MLLQAIAGMHARGRYDFQCSDLRLRLRLKHLHLIRYVTWGRYDFQRSDLRLRL